MLEMTRNVPTRSGMHFLGLLGHAGPWMSLQNPLRPTLSKEPIPVPYLSFNVPLFCILRLELKHHWWAVWNTSSYTLGF